jgi:methionine synthase II (cobalamin-independent)
LAKIYANNTKRKVVLGLVTSKFPDLVYKEKLISRINEAKKFIPLDNLSLSGHCRFASTKKGKVQTKMSNGQN